MKVSFTEWMRQVDQTVLTKVGLSIYDLSDMPFVDMYERGVTPKSAATKSIRNEGGNF